MPTSDLPEGPITTADFRKPPPYTRPISVTPAIDYFLVDERNRSYVKGHSDRLPARQQPLWYLTMFGMLLVFILVLFLVPTIHTYWLLMQTGISANAAVIDHDLSVIQDSRGRSNTVYSITYNFRVPLTNGETYPYTATQNVSLATYDSYPPGASIAVIYLPGNPMVSMIAVDSTDYDGAARTLAFSLGTELLGILVLGVLWCRMRNWARLGREGVLITATLKWASGSWRKLKGAHYYQVKFAYYFTDPQTNQLYNKQVSVIRNDLHGYRLPSTGTLLYVIFLDKNNHALL